MLRGQESILMNEPKYLSAVQQAVAATKGEFLLTGNYLLVERVPKPEVKTKSGLVLATAQTAQIGSIDANMPVFVHVLAVGEGYFDAETGADQPLDTKPGDILLVGQHSVKWLPVYPIDNYELFSVGVTSEAETQMRFRGLEAYRRFAEELNRKAEGAVETPAG